MFAKTKCFMVLNRTGRFVQTRSIRKTSHLKYSVVKGLSSVEERSRTRTGEQSEVETGPESSSGELSRISSNKFQYNERLLINKKTKLDELIRRTEDLVGCRFHRSRSSPIGVGLSPERGAQEEEQYFNLLPSWFTHESENSLISSRIPLLLGSGHPILKLKQNLDPDDKEHSLTLLSSNVQWRAFIILLVSKALSESRRVGNESKKVLELKEARIRTLSEISEMMHFAFALHRTIVEIKHSQDVAMEEKESSLQLGNKVAILFGDLLLARTSKGLSTLKNSKVTELMSDAISDFSESEILRRKHYDFFEPVLSGTTSKSKDDVGSGVFKEFADLTSGTRTTRSCGEVPTLESWKARVNLDIASLIGRSCLCSTLLSQLDEGANHLAFSIGRQIGLVIQAYNDLESYNRGKNRAHPSIDLCTLPVVFHLNSDSIERIQKPVDISEIYHGVMTSPDALLKSQNALENLKADALRLISALPRNSQAPEILEEFVVSLS